MKGMIIDKNIDLSLEIKGESWEQGQTITGVLKLINKTQDSQTPQFQKLILAYVDIKKFKALDESSYKIIQTLDLGQCQLKPKESLELPWSLQLDENAFITDKKSSLYVFWGDLSKNIPASMMLNVVAHNSIRKILDLWEIFFRFTKKDIISLKDQTLEVKFSPPSAKEFATLELLKVQFKRTTGDLNLKCIASINSVTADTTGMKLAKSQRVFDAQWKEKNYLLMPTALNQEFVQTNINSILNALMNKK